MSAKWGQWMWSLDKSWPDSSGSSFLSQIMIFSCHWIWLSQSDCFISPNMIISFHQICFFSLHQIWILASWTWSTSLRIPISPMLSYFVNTCLAIWPVNRKSGQMQFWSLTCFSIMLSTSREIKILQDFLVWAAVISLAVIFYQDNVLPPKKPQIVVSFRSE